MSLSHIKSLVHYQSDTCQTEEALVRLFETASGTTPGRKHRGGLLAHNQDAVQVVESAHTLTMVVSDGCSESPRSHVASSLQVDWFTAIIHYLTRGNAPLDNQWETVTSLLAGNIRDQIHKSTGWILADPKSEEEKAACYAQAVADTWSATIGAIVVQETYTHFAAFGDPRFIINGDLLPTDNAPNAKGKSTPAYPGYLVSGCTLPPSFVRFRVFRLLTADITTAVVATDGLDELIAAEGKIVPGRSETVPNVSHLWDGAMFNKPNAPTRFLNLVGRDWREGRGNLLSGGHLGDDTAFASLRRKSILEV